MRKLALSAVAILLLIGGCSREIDKVTGTDSLPLAPEAPSGLTVQTGDGELELSWESGAVGEIALYLVYRSDSAASNFVLLDSAVTNSHDDRAVQNNVRYYYQVSAVSVGGVEGRRSNSVSGIPGLFSIRIEDDADFTNSRSVSVASVYTAVTSHIMLSNSSEFSGSKWQNASATTSWELPDQDGNHTVYARFKMVDGNESIDRVAFIESFTSDDGGAVLSAGDVIHFRMVTGEPGGKAEIRFPEVGALDLFDNGTAGDMVVGDGTYELDYTIPPDVEFERGTVTGGFTDAAANGSPAISLDHTLTIRNVPLPVVLFLNGAFEDRMELAWSESGDDDFESYRIYRSKNKPVTESSHLVARVSSITQVTVTDDEVVPSTTYNYMVVVSDATGLTANSNTITVTSLDNTAPSSVVAAFEKTDSTSFRLTWTQNRDSDFESYRI
jgi:fibronectin type 3 domain-containing protein